MHRNRSKLTAVVLVAAIALGVPALAKSAHSGKAVASLSTSGLKAERAPALNTHRSERRAPTFAAPNPTSPALSADGTAYNINFYVY